MKKSGIPLQYGLETQTSTNSHWAIGLIIIWVTHQPTLKQSLTLFGKMPMPSTSNRSKIDLIVMKPFFMA
ncbi:hypothetical protein [Pedobacter yonginense]|uniref:hypothetical protein n=1 Tax=Pedobacter yonginense TaxID=651869 RepID=UPI001057A19C|nr:hypothetical protein [Pedobacter yonginense]